MQGHTPFGYKIHYGKIIIDNKKCKTVQTIFREYAAGTSTHALAIKLTEEGCLNASGKPSWCHGTIGRMLENVKYVGNENYPPIISQEEFDTVQKRRAETREHLSRGEYRKKEKSETLFRNKMICGACGQPYYRCSKYYRTREKNVWRCKNYIYQNAVYCKGGFITDNLIKQALTEAINQIITNPELIDRTKQENCGGKTKEYHLLENQIADWEQGNKRELTTEEIIAIAYKRASEGYKTLQIQDMDLKKESMKKAIYGRKTLSEFDEQLYLEIVKEIKINKDNTLEVEFINSLTIKIQYQ